MIFGEKFFSAEELTERICFKHVIQLRKIGLAEVKRVLRELGKEAKLYVSPDDAPDPYPGERQPEYMLDMMWQRKGQTKDGRSVHPDVVLAIESERGRDRGDFEKLMHVKAPQKLFIFWSSPGKSGLKCRQELQQDMAMFTQHVCGEEYVLVEFRQAEHKAFRYKYEVQQETVKPTVSNSAKRDRQFHSEFMFLWHVCSNRMRRGR